MKQQERTVKSGSDIIKYTLTRKNVKNINLRVREDGSVVVSAPSRVAVSVIDGFVREKATFITNAQNKRCANGEKKSWPRYEKGEPIYILGDPIYPTIVRGEKKQVAFHNDGRLIITVNDTDDTDTIEMMLLSLYKDLAKRVFNDALVSIYTKFEPHGVPFPKLRIRDMKTRWGSCSPQNEYVTLNLRLIALPPHATAYIVVHELCHFLHPNHSKAFYDCLTPFMPHWKKHREMLLEWSKLYL